MYICLRWIIIIILIQSQTPINELVCGTYMLDAYAWFSIFHRCYRFAVIYCHVHVFIYVPVGFICISRFLRIIIHHVLLILNSTSFQLLTTNSQFNRQSAHHSIVINAFNIYLTIELNTEFIQNKHSIDSLNSSSLMQNHNQYNVWAIRDVSKISFLHLHSKQTKRYSDLNKT